MNNILDNIVKELGFENEKEFHKLVASIDISTPEKNKAFKRWQHSDGTKRGLEKLIKSS